MTSIITDKKYNIIYLDPPWKYGGTGGEIGNYTMSSCEFVLLFKRGKIPEDRVRNPGTLQFLSCPIGRHSQKPHIIRERINSLFPKSSKIELFSRCICDGWDSWGNALNDDNSVIETNSNTNSKIITQIKLF